MTQKLWLSITLYFLKNTCNIHNVSCTICNECNYFYLTKRLVMDLPFEINVCVIIRIVRIIQIQYTVVYGLGLRSDDIYL